MLQQCCTHGRARPAHLGLPGVACAGKTCPTLPVRAFGLPRRSSDLQPLRPWQPLLRRWMREHGSPRAAARCWRALSKQLRRAHQARRAHPVLATAQGRAGAIGDASGFPTRPARCCTGCHSTNSAGHRGDGHFLTMHLHTLYRRCERDPVGSHTGGSGNLALPLVRSWLQAARAPWLPAA